MLQERLNFISSILFSVQKVRKLYAFFLSFPIRINREKFTFLGMLNKNQLPIKNDKKLDAILCYIQSVSRSFISIIFKIEKFNIIYEYIKSMILVCIVKLLINVFLFFRCCFYAKITFHFFEPYASYYANIKDWHA